MGRIVELSITDICKRYKVELVDNNISLQNCPKCGGKTERKEINNIRIGIKLSTPATKRRMRIYQCSNCGAKLTNRGLVVASFHKLRSVLESNNIKLQLNFENNENEVVEEDLEEKGIMGKIWTKYGEKVKEYTVVEDPKKQNSAAYKFWIGRGIIQDAINAIATGNLKKFNGGEVILKWKGTKLKEELKKRERLCDPQIKTAVTLFDGKLPCPSHPKEVECVTALIYCTKSNRPEKMSINYCKECERYYINSESYRQYAELYGLPMLRLSSRRLGGKIDYNEWNKESELAAYGYSAGESKGLGETHRQRLLADLVDSGLMTKSEIVGWLEFLIRTRKNVDGSIVQSRRKSDLRFLNNYRINEQRFVWAKITPNQKRRR